MTETWIERAPYLLVAGVLILSFTAFKKIMDPQSLEKEEINYSYEMPRVKVVSKGFSFSGRKIIASYRGFEEDNAGNHDPQNQTTTTDSNETQKPTASLDKTSANKAQKGKDDKKNTKANAKTAKKEDNKKNNKLAQLAKPQMTVTIHPNSDGFNTKMRNLDNNEVSENKSGYATVYPNNLQARQVVNVQNEEDTDKLTPQQWRSLLFSQPSSKNIAQFEEAYKKKEVDEAAYFQIANELFSDTAADRQKAGFEILKASPSAKAFTILVSHIQESTADALKTEITSVLKTYSETSKFGILSQLLFSAEARVVQTAQSLIAQALAKLQNTQTQANGRETRSPGSTAANPQAFNGFLPGLKRLMASNNSAIASAAQSLVEAINSLKLPA